MVQSDSSLKLVADYYNCYLTNCRHGCLDFFWDVDNIFDQKLGKTGDFHIFLQEISVLYEFVNQVFCSAC